jgi:hypothetical protein
MTGRQVSGSLTTIATAIRSSGSLVTSCAA